MTTSCQSSPDSASSGATRDCLGRNLALTDQSCVRYRFLYCTVLAVSLVANVFPMALPHLAYAQRGASPRVEPARPPVERERFRDESPERRHEREETEAKRRTELARKARESHELSLLGNPTDTHGKDLRVYVGVEEGGLPPLPPSPFPRLGWLPSPGQVQHLYLRTNLNQSEVEEVAIAGSKLSLVGITQNLLRRHSNTGRTDSELARAVTFYVHHSAFTRGNLSMDMASNVFVVDDNYKTYKATALVNGDVKTTVELVPGLYLRVEDLDQRDLLDRLRGLPFDLGMFRLLSLVNNSETLKALTSSNLRGNLLDFGLSATPSKAEDLKALLFQQRGHLVALLGHLEDGAFVTIDERGEELLNVSVATLEQWAAEGGLRLLLLGCNSAKSSTGVGVSGKFNSLDAIERLTVAVSAANFADFLIRLCCKEKEGRRQATLPLVLSKVIDTSANRPSGRNDIAWSVHETVDTGSDAVAISARSLGLVQLPSILSPVSDPTTEGSNGGLYVLGIAILFCAVSLALARRNVLR